MQSTLQNALECLKCCKIDGHGILYFLIWEGLSPDNHRFVANYYNQSLSQPVLSPKSFPSSLCMPISSMNNEQLNKTKSLSFLRNRGLLQHSCVLLTGFYIKLSIIMPFALQNVHYIMCTLHKVLWAFCTELSESLHDITLSSNTI